MLKIYVVNMILKKFFSCVALCAGFGSFDSLCAQTINTDCWNDGYGNVRCTSRGQEVPGTATVDPFAFQRGMDQAENMRRQAEMHNMQMEIMRRQLDAVPPSRPVPEDRPNPQPGVLASRQQRDAQVVCSYRPLISGNFLIKGKTYTSFGLPVAKDAKCSERIQVGLDGSFRMSSE
ncbi:MAG: hypothetical protein ACKO0Z_04050 [Betaproteobacteria bacterium]